MTSLIAEKDQSNAMQVLAELETAYRALRSAASGIIENGIMACMTRSGIKCGDPISKINGAMDAIQEVQRDVMFSVAVRSEAKMKISKKEK